MYSAAFIFEPGEYDDEFHRLNAIIDVVAKSLPGFLGVDSWQSTSGSLRNVTYFWSDLETLKTFSMHPAHRKPNGNTHAGTRAITSWCRRYFARMATGPSRMSRRTSASATADAALTRAKGTLC